MADNVNISIITRSQDLPSIQAGSFFHSTELFSMVEQTRGQTPFMVVAQQDGQVVAHMLAILRRRGSLLPPYLFTQGRVYGEGEYAEGTDREALFSLMLEAITSKLRRKLCLYIEFSDLSTKMFAYRHFRTAGYFPVQWMRIHNSLHSMPPEDRLNEKMLARIERGYNSGVVTQQVADYDEFRDFYRMLHQFFSLKIRRYLPPERQFYEMGKSPNCSLFITKYNNRVIGGCTVVYSLDKPVAPRKTDNTATNTTTQKNAYLWYMASRRKRYAHLHPGTLTVWHALKTAHEQGCRHFYFMDIGLPFRKNLHRDFILRFGGKPVGTYRWFHFTIGWLNKLLSWMYRE